MKNIIKNIKTKKAQLDAMRPLSCEQVQNLKNVYDVLLTYNSNAIEGSTLSYSETKLILNEGITIGGKSINEHLEVINHKEAIGYIEELVSIGTNEITLKDIKNIHALVLSKIDKKNAGVYRTQDVGIVKSDGSVHKFTDPLLLDEKMQEFIEWLNSSEIDEPILLATLAHLKFVTIHPFIDGNGRCARLLMNLILLQYGYPQAIIKVSNRAEYIKAIEEAQSDTKLNYDAFYKVILQSVHDSFELYMNILNDDIKII